jgi:hypothetical protein
MLCLLPCSFYGLEKRIVVLLYLQLRLFVGLEQRMAFRVAFSVTLYGLEHRTEFRVILASDW